MDEPEFERLYRDAGQRLVATTYAACGDLQEAQDCVQEAFIKAWLRRRELDATRSPEAWVRVTALRLAVSRWRRANATGRAWGRVGPVPPAGPPDATTVDLLRAMRTLPPRARIAVVMHYMCDMAVADIAADTGMSVNTVKSHLHRARRTLAPVLAPGRAASEEAAS